jgi:cytochrome c biogenesis protein
MRVLSSKSPIRQKKNTAVNLIMRQIAHFCILNVCALHAQRIDVQGHGEAPPHWRAICLTSFRTRCLLTASPQTLSRRFWMTILLIVAGLASAAGTFILQRPLTDPEKMQRAYSPAALHWLDALGLTDVFHAWWFAALLALLGINIVLASIERFPTAWHYFARPYRRPEPHFLVGLPVQREIPIDDVQTGMLAAEHAFRRMGFKPQRVGDGADASLYVEKYRFARLAAYVVHASLLLIFVGGIVDAVWGYRGFVALGLNDQTNQIELTSGARKALPFTIQCRGAGQENYPDGSPRRWWSKLAVLENGREVKRKEISVNHPLVYGGVRFFQASYGSTGEVSSIELMATPRNGSGRAQEIELQPNETVRLDPGTTVRLASFVPDFVLNGDRVESRSEQPNNPAIQLAVESKQAGKSTVWLFPRFPDFTHPDKSPYTFQFRDLRTGYYTGLQVAHEPGQWAVWAGVILMGLGLAMAFYFVHLRFWVVPLSDDRGRRVLWVGASASKNREDLEERFGRLVGEIETNLKTDCAACGIEPVAVPARI